ncbi:MAG: DUF433 domain-containing protein, partial [Dolichospermum sp.]
KPCIRGMRITVYDILECSLALVFILSVCGMIDCNLL